MKLTETISTQPIRPVRTTRTDNKRIVTSGKAGKIIPVAYFPLLREDAITGNANIRIEMMETEEMLMNAVTVTVMAHFVPFLAFPKFSGLDEFNASYAGVPLKDGDDVIPFFEEYNIVESTDEVHTTLGIHSLTSGINKYVNSSILTGYNVLTNFRRKSRSTKLEDRGLLANTLAPAFWHHSTFKHIVPDFDQAAIDGEVPLALSTNKIPVTGLIPTSSTSGSEPWMPSSSDPTLRPAYQFSVEMKDGEPNVTEVFAELEAQNLSISLSNLEAAKNTAAFARLREQYNGLDDEYLKDLLMDGIRIPAEEMSQPVLLDRKSTIVGYSRRYATDSGNLDDSVTNGETFVDLRIRTPAMNTGGIVYITCEIVPEQMFERQTDYFANEAFTVDDLPNFSRDFLDPEKVDIVKNKHVDIKHTDPDGTFGYAPLNHGWQRDTVSIGGKYYRPDPLEAEDFNRQKFWATEVIDPSLTEDFYVCPEDLPHQVFQDQVNDPFEITARCQMTINGNTVFGKGLIEDNENYVTIADEVDYTRIDQTEE